MAPGRQKSIAPLAGDAERRGVRPSCPSTHQDARPATTITITSKATKAHPSYKQPVPIDETPIDRGNIWSGRNFVPALCAFRVEKPGSVPLGRPTALGSILRQKVS